MAGVGRIVTGAVPSLSCPASQVPQCCYSIRDGGAVTGVSGWDPGHIHCGKAVSVAVVLDIVLGLAKIAPVVLQCPCRRRGRRWCMVTNIRRGGIRWALWARVLHAPAVVVAVVGCAAVPDPLVGARACTLEGPGDTWRSRTS